MITLYEYVEDSRRLLRPYEWDYDPDADTIRLVYDPYSVYSVIHNGLVIEDAMRSGYLENMYLPPDVADWLPER